ncbi:MAG: Mur ligase family protein [Chitinophagales bacterium]
MRIAICGSHGKTTITSMVMHVLRKAGMHFDYLVGAQLEGFNTMVQLSHAPVIIIEGDEYFASPLDKRPKFLLYHADTILVSGIAWDHYNVFPTYDAYVSTFHSLLRSMPASGTCYYYAGDAEIKRLLDAGDSLAENIPYTAPHYTTHDNGTALKYAGKEYIFPVIGRHNMENMEGAKCICTQLGISASDFYTYMQTFRGAAKRMQVLRSTDDHIIYRDFAHAPSKVKATVQAIKEQYPGKQLAACLELHTFSSLNMDFIPQYAGTMSAADHRIVYFNPHAVALKKLPPLDPDAVRTAMQDPHLIVTDNAETLKSELEKINNVNTHILLMSSGNYDNLDFGFLT